MRCKKHNRGAGITCDNCGNVLCEECTRIRVGDKIACSEECENRIKNAINAERMDVVASRPTPKEMNQIRNTVVSVIVIVIVTAWVISKLLALSVEKTNRETTQKLKMKEKILKEEELDSGLLKIENWEKITPLELIEKLKNSTAIQIIVWCPLKFKTKEKDLSALIKLLDSKEECAGVVSPEWSGSLTSKSTVSKEAAFLIEGYRKKQYPPSLYAPNFDKGEIIQWWGTFNRPEERIKRILELNKNPILEEVEADYALPFLGKITGKVLKMDYNIVRKVNFLKEPVKLEMTLYFSPDGYFLRAESKNKWGHPDKVEFKVIEKNHDKYIGHIGIKEDICFKKIVDGMISQGLNNAKEYEFFMIEADDIMMGHSKFVEAYLYGVYKPYSSSAGPDNVGTGVDKNWHVKLGFDGESWGYGTLP